MAQITTLYLDLCPAFIPFTIQATKADGTAGDVTVDTLAIYEEDGADGTVIANTDEIGNSPFDPVNIATGGLLTGWWNVMIAKSNFTAGKFYLCRWQCTIDGVVTAKTEIYFFINSSSVKATVTNLDVAVSTRATPSDVTTAHSTTDGKVDAVQVDTTAIDGKTTNLPADPASETNVDANETKIDLLQVDSTAILVDTVSIEAKIDIMDALIDLILLDTGELQTDWTNGGRLDLILDLILADTAEMQPLLPTTTIASEALASTNTASIISKIDEGVDLRTTEEG